MKGSQQSRGSWGGLARSLLRLSGVAAVTLVLVACSGSSALDAPTVTTSVTASSFSSTSLVIEDPPSTTTTSATAIPAVTAAEVFSDGEVFTAWDAFWGAWSAVRASEDLDPGPLEGVAVPEVVAGVVALFERQRESGLGAVESDVVTSARVVDQGSDEVAIEDCVLISPPFTDALGVWYQADLTRTGQGWVVEALRIPSGGGCAPQEMADPAIAGYEAYYEAEAEFWDPPDPSSPLLDQVLVDPQRSFTVGLLEQHLARRVALRGQPTTHPEVIEVRSPTELIILSCSAPDPGYGLYDLDTSERLPDEPPVRAGQRDLQSAVMVLDGGKWKVSDLQGQVDFACEFSPTDRGLPSV